MYSAFYLQPKVEKERRVIRLDPPVKDLNVAMFTLMVHRRKDMAGGVLVGSMDNLQKCWSVIEMEDGNFPDDMEQVKMRIFQIAEDNHCTVAYHQESQQPSFSSVEEDSITFLKNKEHSLSCLNEFLDSAVNASVFSHINETPYYDIDTEDNKVTVRISKFAVGKYEDTYNKIVEFSRKSYPECVISNMDTDPNISMSIYPNTMENSTTLHVMSNTATQSRFLVSASFSFPLNKIEGFTAGIESVAKREHVLREIVSANIFLPKKRTHGDVLPKVDGKPDVIPFDLTLKQGDDELLPVLNALFEGESRGGRGAVLAYGIKDSDGNSRPSMLFVLKGPTLTSENAALMACRKVVNERYGSSEEEQLTTEQGTEVKTPKVAGMAYFRFRT